jgi:ribosomal-protein-alanine N-acetyltransferase
MTNLHTTRLILIPTQAFHLEAELDGKGNLSELLSAQVPSNWPPEMLRDALPYFLAKLRESPQSTGWNAWYWVKRGSETEPAVLVGDGGFKAVPDSEGQVEIGYSILPQFQGFGYATEVARALVDWAFSHSEVACVIGETDPANAASIRVLRKLGFAPAGPGSEEGTVRWTVSRTGEPT